MAAVWIALSTALLIVQLQIARSGSVISRFQLASRIEQFQHLVSDSSTGHLYAGATNALYQLEDSGSHGLTVVQRYRTGPEMDSPLCNYNGDCIFSSSASSSSSSAKRPTAAATTTNKTLTNNFNQILLLHPTMNALIACGTLRQGVCTLHHTDNISRTFDDDSINSMDRSAIPVAANSANATTVAFLGDPDGEGGSTAPVLYAATTFTYDAYRDAFPSLATRSLTTETMFQLVDPGDVTGQSGLMIRNEYRADFRVFYVGGFHYGQHAYWLSVQRATATDPTSPYVTKVLRVCANDARYETYSELPLECLGADNSQYNVMKAFYIGRLGLADQLDDSEQYLVGVFTKANDPWKMDGAKQQQQPRAFHSAICAFSLKDIRSAFAFALQRCNSGIGKWNLPHFGFDQKCYNISGQHHHMRHRENMDPLDSCQQPLRVGAEMPATSAALITYFGPLLTSIAGEVIEDTTVLFVGTNEGKLKKINLQTIKNGREYGEVELVSTISTMPGVKSGLGNWTTSVPSGAASVNPDMVFDPDRRHLYVMTKNELLKVAVDACSSYENCDTCLASNDPYCGWCTLENRCSRKDDCPSSNHPYGFLATNLDEMSTRKSICPRIESVSPANVSFSAPGETKVSIAFNFLPRPESSEGGAYRCMFDASATPAEFVPPSTLRCQLPPPQDRPKRIRDHEMEMAQVQLRLWSSISGTVFHEIPFTFYDCGVHRRCTSCLASKFTCGWCLTENKCVDSSTGTCDGGTVTQTPPTAMGVMRHRGKNSSHSKTPTVINQCPHIDVNDTPEIFVPNGRPFAIRIPVANLDKLRESDKFGALECVMVIERKETKVRGWLAENGKTVTCESQEFTYKSESSILMADFSLQTGNGVIIDQMKVQIYKCELLGPDCTRCRNADARYQCGWCNGQCRHRKSCTPEFAVDSSSDTCPAPSIKSIAPLSGPIEGGTRLEIIGYDFGMRREEIQGRISIGGRVLCEVVEYTTAERIVCITGSSVQEFQGPVEIRLANNQHQVGRSQQSFRFVQPTVDGFYPHVGPRSGGTELVISGTYLLDSTSTEVYVGPLPCKIDRWKSTSERLVCKTTASYDDRRTYNDITVIMDKANRTLNGRFDYTPDPRVTNIHPLVTFTSGGRQLVVCGRHLDSVQRPLIFFMDARTGRLASESSICQVFNATLMICPSPAMLPMRAVRLNRRALLAQETLSYEPTSSIRSDQFENSLDAEIVEEPQDLSTYDRYKIGFIMDSVESLKRLDDLVITVVPDPIYVPFANGRKLTSKGEPLLVDGTNLNLASSEMDVRVTVGLEPCEITVITSTRLVCQPAYDRIDEQRAKAAAESNGAPPDPDDIGPLVIVRVGYLEFVIGRLVYDESDMNSLLLATRGGNRGSSTTGGAWNTAVIGGLIGVGVAFCAALLVAVALWWRRRMWMAEKEYERVRMQLDSHEPHDLQEYKTAFVVDSQTDIPELVASSMGVQGVPYQPRAVFVERILHRGEHGGARSEAEWQEYDEILGDSISTFEELLGQRRFAAALINTLEREQSLGQSDRLRVANSLTTAMLADDGMHSLTDCVLSQLKEAIADEVAHRGKCKLNDHSPPRDDSILDAILTNWIALVMYNHLAESRVGNALFLLYKALKCQTEKGPVDAVTGHARFSLAEESLLKEQVEYETITLRIIPPSVDNNTTETIPCRVLTCDTIGQVKSKILDVLYRNLTFSARPSVDDIELEWRSNQTRTGVFLQDDVYNGMGTVSCNDHWRQLNTVQYYAIPNNAVVAVFIKMRSNYPYDDSNTYMSISSSTYLLSGSSISSGTSPNGGGQQQGNGVSKSKRYSSASTQWPRSEKPLGAPVRYWHLMKPTASFEPSSGSPRSANGSMTELHFARLLSTKSSVQQYVDEFFAAVTDSSSIPLAMKFLFDTIDDEIARSAVVITDPNIAAAESWKLKLYFLKFWSHLILNVDSLYDVERSSTLQSCMNMISRCLADISANPAGGKTAVASNPFARDVPKYRQMIARFLGEIGRRPRVDEREAKSLLAPMSKFNDRDLRSSAGAVQELFTYAVRYREQVLEALSTDSGDGTTSMRQRFEEISTWAGRQSIV